MAIRKTDKVKLNGSSKGYGGLITDASYNVGFGTQVTQLVLTFVSEDGNYNISQDSLNVFDVDVITLGSRSLKMIAIEYSIDNSFSGKVLKVTYNDTSILILDKKFVALKGKNFPANLQSDALILVGQKYYTQEKQEGDESITLNRSTFSNDIREVGDYLYNFSELMDLIRIYTINTDEALRRNSDVVLKDITGTLRSVLSAWGSLYGFTFFFNESEKIQFVDLTSDITPVFPTNINFISERISYSLKDTVSKGHSVYYSKPGKDISSGGSAVGILEPEPEDPENIDYGEFSEDSDTQLFLYRPTDDPAKLWNNPGFAIDLAKAVAVGEQFFQLCALYLCKVSENKYSSIFGYANIETLTDYQKTAFDPKDDLYTDYHIVKYLLDESAQTVTPETIKQKFAQFLTYENNLSERQYFAHNWAIGADLKYDIEDTTEYVNPDRKTKAEDNHRVYATVPFDLAFDVYDSVQNMDLNKSIIFLEVSSAARKTARANNTYNPNIRFAAVKKDMDFSYILERIRFKYLNRKVLRVEGLRVKDKVTIIPGGGGGDERGGMLTAAIESLHSIAPSYNANTLITDVEIETSPAMVSALSDIIDVPGGNIKFDGTFEINGKLNGYPSLAYTIDQKTVQKSFTVNNIDLEDYTPTIEKGLQSIEINVGEDGVKTTYTIGNRNFVLPSKELLTQPRGYVKTLSVNKAIQSTYSLRSSLNSLGN